MLQNRESYAMKNSQPKIVKLDAIEATKQMLHAAKSDSKQINSWDLRISTATWMAPKISIASDCYCDSAKSGKLDRKMYLNDTKIGQTKKVGGWSREAVPYTIFDVNFFWKANLIRITDNEKNQQALEFFDKTVIRDEKGHSATKWPWQLSILNLPNNFGLCLERLKSLIKLMQESPDLFEENDKMF